MSLRDDINIPVLVVLGGTTALIVAVAIIGTQAGYNYVTGVDLARNYAAAEERGILHFGQNVFAPQTAALKADQPAWTNVDKSAVRIPIDRAKELMIESKGKAKAYQAPAAPAKKEDAKKEDAKK